MIVNVAGTFKADERELNGLESIAADLIEQPLQRRLVIALVEPKRVIEDFGEDGSKRVVVRIVHLEPITGDAADDARKHLQDAYRVRTGREAATDTLFDHH